MVRQRDASGAARCRIGWCVCDQPVDTSPVRGRPPMGYIRGDSCRVPAHPSDVLRICIPVHNEATTIGVLLWRLRSVFQGFSREYDVVVYDDASTDGTDEVLEPYRSVMPLTVLRGNGHRGYAASIDALVRHVAADDEYARRDAMVLLQGDFTESPEHLPELVKRFEGGADLVAVHRAVSDATPADERRLRRWGRWAVTPFLRLPPVADPFTGFRLVRISVLRELLKALGSRPVCAGDGWAANIDFALNVTPFARRIENVEFAPRYDVRQRSSRRRGWPDVLALFHWARAARRTTRPAPGGRAVTDAPPRVDRAAEVAPTPVVPARGSRQTERVERTDRSERVRPELARPDRGPRPDRPDRPDRPARPPRPERNRQEPAGRGESSAASAPAAPVASPVAATELRDAESTAELAAGLEAELSTSPAEKRSRRRRRRSRKDRGSRATDGAVAEEEATGTAAPADAVQRDAGTSDGGEGEQEDGDDDTDGDAVEAGTESVSDGGRRKRRSRRRRRGRRPGGVDVTDGDRPPPPAAEPPAA